MASFIPFKIVQFAKIYHKSRSYRAVSTSSKTETLLSINAFPFLPYPALVYQILNDLESTLLTYISKFYVIGLEKFLHIKKKPISVNCLVSRNLKFRIILINIFFFKKDS
jgi:hypothetical protein